MATTSSGSSPGTGSPPVQDYDGGRGDGWVSFAGIMIALVGTLNVIYGIAAISDSKFYVANTKFIISNLHAYGWLLLIVGAVQVAAAFAIFGRATWARWVGIISASVNAIVQLVWISAYPAASIALLFIDLLVIYGLVAYGKHSQAVL